jgi:RHS repeat-associated protein
VAISNCPVKHCFGEVILFLFLKELGLVPVALNRAKTASPGKTAIVSNTKPKKSPAHYMKSPLVCPAIMEQLPKCQKFVSRFNYAAAGKIVSNPEQISTVACAGVDPLYSYDILNRVTSMTSPAGATSYHYDPVNGMLDRITSPEGKVFSYAYNKGQLESLQYPNGITANYAFDTNSNLTDLNYQRGGGASVARYQYSYDNNNMRTGMTDNDGTHNYTYDSLYQIIAATHPTPPRPLEQFQYDQAGNRLGGGRVHNELNQLTEDDSCRYAYDADGNMVSKVSKATGDSTIYTWDIENTLTEVRKSDMLARYTYDVFGRRLSKEVNGVKTQFRYDDENLILETNDSGVVNANYTFGPGIDNPLEMNRNGNVYYYVKDGLGSVTALTNNSGNIVHTYKYSVFGEIIAETGDSINNPFTYTSRELDKETGNYFYRARYYGPKIGRFINEDPIGFWGMDINLYRYVWNSTVNLVDIFGLKPGDVFQTLDGAGKDAVLYINPTSITKNLEYGGYITTTPGGYTYSEPTQGTPTGLTMPPKPDNAAADFHTHAAYDPNYNNEEFSKADKNSNKNTGIPGYLGTP